MARHAGLSWEHRFCCAVSGFDDLSPRFAAAAMNAMRGADPPGRIDQAQAAFERGGIETVLADPALAPIVKALLLFLYTGFGPSPAPFGGDPANHFESLMWRAAMAHPPALSGGYFGHWSYPPDEVG